jgi:hypothetical protein
MIHTSSRVVRLCRSKRCQTHFEAMSTYCSHSTNIRGLWDDHSRTRLRAEYTSDQYYIHTELIPYRPPPVPIKAMPNASRAYVQVPVVLIRQRTLVRVLYSLLRLNIKKAVRHSFTYTITSGIHIGPIFSYVTYAQRQSWTWLNAFTRKGKNETKDWTIAD